MWQLGLARDCVLPLYSFYTVTNIVSSSIAMLTIYVVVVLGILFLTATNCSPSTRPFPVDISILFMAGDIFISFRVCGYSVIT